KSTSRGSRVEVLSSSLGGSPQMDSKALAALQDRYSIPREYRLHAPSPRQCPYDPFPNGFKLTLDALEVGLRFPLHLVIVECLRGVPGGENRADSDAVL
ncbi:unnamed protein product, partial [Musa textilis]